MSMLVCTWGGSPVKSSQIQFTFQQAPEENGCRPVRLAANSGRQTVGAFVKEVVGFRSRSTESEVVCDPTEISARGPNHDVSTVHRVQTLRCNDQTLLKSEHNHARSAYVYEQWTRACFVC